MVNPKEGQTAIKAFGERLTSGGSNEQTQLDNGRISDEIAQFRDPHLVAQLHEYSITTFEEVLALGRVVPDLLQGILGLDLRVLAQPGHFELRNPGFLSPLVQLYPQFERYNYGLGLRLERPEGHAFSGLPEDTNETEGENPKREWSLIDKCMGPIRDQGNRGTCVAFAVCAAVEYALCKSNGKRVGLSEQFSYWDCKANDGDPQEGTYPAVGFALAMRDGICRKHTWRYNPRPNPSNPTYDPPPPQACIEAANYRVREARSIKMFRDKAVLKRYIADSTPVAVGIPVYDSWERSPNARITGNLTLPLPGEQPTGGHAVVLVGYADNNDFAGGGYFVFRNSWGTKKWGVRCPYGAGYGTVPYRYIERLNMGAWIVRV